MRTYRRRKLIYDINMHGPVICDRTHYLIYEKHLEQSALFWWWNGFFLLLVLLLFQNMTKIYVHAKSLQSCLTLWDPMDCSLPGTSVCGILQARILEWVAVSFSRGTSQPRDQTWVSCIPGRCFTIWATREAPIRYLYFPERIFYVDHHIICSLVPVLFLCSKP